MENENVVNNTIEQNSSYAYAGFWIRFLAVMLDGVIIVIPLNLIFGFLSNISNLSFINYLGILCGLIYIIYFEGTTGQTLGKKIVGVKVIDYEGKTIGIPNAALRYIGKIISGLILGIGYIMAAFDEKKQSLHDKIVKTYVIKL